VAVGTGVAFRLGTELRIVVAFIFEVVVAFDVAGEELVLFVILPVHPATNTVANTIVIMHMTKSCFFIFIPSSGKIFPQLEVLLLDKTLCVFDSYLCESPGYHL